MTQLELAFDSPSSRGKRRREAALRGIALAGGLLWYRFMRGRRRTVTIVVGRSGLEVRAPRCTPIAEVEDFLRQKERWIRLRIQEAGREPPPVAWREGEHLTVLGEALRIAVVGAPPAVRRADDRIEVGPPLGSGAQSLRAAVLEWMRAEASQVFQGRIALYAHRLGVRPPELRLSNARTQWGSCNAQGRILLNWRLVQLPLALIDYVIAHELAHLRELNHSGRFWALVESLYPGYASARGELERVGKQLPEL